ncbi:MAG: hypothetical protein JNM81_13380 [Rhodospirillaceae bacterium]|nr:hypothetical protein [Rhodospirillaceae bacterium]
MFKALQFAVAASAVVFVTQLAAAQDVPAAESTERVVEIKNPEKYLRRMGPQPSAEAQEAAREMAERTQAQQTPSPLLNQAKPSKGSSTAERAQAIITGSWTVIPNATPGALGNISYVRFPNANTLATATYTVRIIGDSTGRDYGTATFTVPPRASPQYSMQDLLAIARGTSFDPNDLNLTLYVRSSHYYTGYQHVYYNTNTGFFENMSVCSYVNGMDYRPLMSGVVNVHSSLLSSLFPSLITIHNENAFSTTIRARVYESQIGTYRGIVSFVAAANSTYTFLSSDIEAELGYTPGSNIYHLNLVYDGDPSNPPNVMTSHIVTNLRVFGSVLNLTAICSIDD